MKLGRSSPGAQLGDPLAVPQIRPAAWHVAHVRRVAHADRDPLGQRVVDRPPVHPVDSMAASGTPSPASHAAIGCSDPQNVKNLRTVTTASQEATPRPRSFLVHVDRGDPRMDDIHRHLLPRPPILMYGRAVPRSPQQDRDPLTRARSSNPGVHGKAPASGLDWHAAPSTGDVSGWRRPQVSSIRGRHVGDMKSWMMATSRCGCGAGASADGIPGIPAPAWMIP
jgi:hypothetical protein